MLRLIAWLSRAEAMTWPRFWTGVRRYLPSVLLDGLIAAVAMALALALRFDGNIAPVYLDAYLLLVPLVVLLYAASSFGFEVYRRNWQYGSVADLLLLGRAVLSATALLFVVDALATGLRPLPFSVVLLTGGLTFVILAALRLWPRLVKEWKQGRGSALPRRRTLIVGAGRTGERLVRQLHSQPQSGYLPVCFVDDASAPQGLRIHDVPIRGDVDDIPSLVKALEIDTIIVAAPSASGAVMRRIVDRCHETEARIVVSPGLDHFLESGPSELLLRELRMEDLLGREMVEIDVAACQDYLASATVLVTGAAGSIGSELCRQLKELQPARLVLFDNNESGLYDLALELLSRGDGGLEIIACPGDITSPSQVGSLFQRFRPTVVFHAAAFKHVPLMEEYPDQAVRVNVGGTRCVAEAALRYGAARMVLISTDKAVHPSSVMGATKRVTELLIQSLATHEATRFCAVRFGNVLGSRGSVVPTFSRQIEWGGPVTVTHPDATRYMIAVPEAARLIIQAGSFAEPRAIYILEMGEEVRILDLATKMIRFHGLRVGSDIQIRFTGLRPGEKLREELSMPEESTGPTPHPGIIKITSPPTVSGPALTQLVDELIDLAEAGDLVTLRRQLFASIEVGSLREPVDLARRRRHLGTSADA
jgi:FlaA1/EpsC-like NDP-sugar epimerase